MLAARLRVGLPVLLRSMGLPRKELVGPHYTPVRIGEMGADALGPREQMAGSFGQRHFPATPSPPAKSREVLTNVFFCVQILQPRLVNLFNYSGLRDGKPLLMCVGIESSRLKDLYLFDALIREV